MGAGWEAFSETGVSGLAVFARVSLFEKHFYCGVIVAK